MFIIIPRAITKTNRQNKTIQRDIFKTQEVNENRILKKMFKYTKRKQERGNNKMENSGNKQKSNINC